MARVVADEQYPQAQAQEDSFELPQDPHGGQVVQGGKGFVEHQEFRLQDQGPGQGDALQFAARQFVGQPLQIVAGQFQQVQDFLDLFSAERAPAPAVPSCRRTFRVRSGSEMICCTVKNGFTAR